LHIELGIGRGVGAVFEGSAKKAPENKLHEKAGSECWS